MTERPAHLPLRLYRVLLAAGGLALVVIGVLYRLDSPADIDPTAGRLAMGLSAVALVGLTFVNDWVRRHALGLVYGFFAVVSTWQIGLAYVNSLAPTAAFGLILVFVGCSAGFQTVRTLMAYSALFVLATGAVAYTIPEPLVPRDAFMATLFALAVLGTFLFRTRMHVLQRLDAAREDALAAARAKSDFLATMSHEIRTPMNGVIGMTDVLATTTLTADQREALDTIRASGDALLGVISDILDFSKIEAGRVDLEARPLSLRDLVEDTLDVVARAAGRRRVEVVGHGRPGVPDVVVGDATRLRQILLNLLSN
ncbi:MAG TPA: histidine kinase dimerization/phospho-acceptor domain-containing protein, partial [Rubricoccaceae bacterium]